MEELQDDLKIYSEEVRDVLSAPPKAIFKWGNTILLVFILLLLFTRWVKLNDLNFDIINWSVKDKFIDILH